ncbi:MAG: dTMP kinase [Proteobacteria bacterium]|nr:dTMP kinase [Pseudomonadota bacterium]MCH8220781.1 dTMP kinase [Pseudomonadota bacterium]MCH8929979.1 dTMP kinase [Pseudomonadota bacterium]
MIGRLITLEGLEGVGKSTNMDFIRRKLQDAGIDVDVTREPGGTPLAEKIRQLVLDTADEPLPDLCELLLIFAARSAHLENRIRPALDHGRWVLCDRFTDATYAYQGGGRGLPLEIIASLEDWIQSGLRPDLTILLDTPVEIGLQRIRERGGTDRFESQRLEFFQRAREVYLSRAQQEPERYVVVDASRPLAQVQDDLAKVIELYLSNF